MREIDVTKKLGFGCLRLPLRSKRQSDIDFKTLEKMIDYYLANGFEYFEAAYNYHDYECEHAIRKCLVERYKRESFILADKMPVQKIKHADEYAKIFNEQLENCGVDYFDYYLLHNINNAKWEKIQQDDGFGFLYQLKEKRKVGKIGFSFHGDAQLLENILNIHAKNLDFVQLQINYLDWKSEAIQSKKCYKIARQFHLPIFVMEPVKGGNLVNNLPKEAKDIFDNYKKSSYAEWAIRWAASLEGVSLVLSGMSDMEQILDNVSYMSSFSPMLAEEKNIVSQVVDIIESSYDIGCTQCRYCVPECPMQIPIPELFSLYNSLKMITTFKGHYYSYIYNNIVRNHGTPKDCIKCGKCEKICSQHLEIRKLLEKFEFERNNTNYNDLYTYSKIVAGKRYVIYGTGKAAVNVFENVYSKGSEVMFFIDSNEKCWGQQLFGKIIYSPNELREKSSLYDEIIIGSSYEKEILTILSTLEINKKIIDRY